MPAVSDRQSGYPNMALLQKIAFETKLCNSTQYSAETMDVKDLPACFDKTVKKRIKHSSNFY